MDTSTDKRENCALGVLNPLLALAEEGRIRSVILAEVERPKPKVIGDKSFSQKRYGIMCLVDEQPPHPKLPFDTFRARRYKEALAELKRDLEKGNILSMNEADLKSLGFSFNSYRVRSIKQLLEFRTAMCEGSVYSPLPEVKATPEGEGEGAPLSEAKPVQYLAAFEDPEPDHGDKAHSIVLGYVNYTIQEDIDFREEEEAPPVE